MTRTVSGTLAALLAAPVTRPGYLVSIGFSPTLYLSSRGTVTYGGKTWTGWDVTVSGLAVDGSTPAQSGSLTLGNTDNSIGALLMGQGVAERAVDVYQLYGEAPAAGDATLIFSGVGDSYQIEPDRGRASIKLEQSAVRMLYSPRRYIVRGNGFSALPQVGFRVVWNGETLVLDRRS